MIKTGKQVQSDILTLIKNTTLSSMVTGGVYRNGYRPRDSKLEDIVVTFTTGLAEQIQTGVVTVNIYVPDIDPYTNGVLVENGSRTNALEIAAQAWVETLTPKLSCYKFRLQQTISTDYDPDIHQHFVTVKLVYEYFD